MVKTTLTIRSGETMEMGFAIDEFTFDGTTFTATISPGVGPSTVVVPKITSAPKRRQRGAARGKVTDTMRREIKRRMHEFGPKYSVGRMGKVMALAEQYNLHYTSLYDIENGKKAKR